MFQNGLKIVATMLLGIAASTLGGGATAARHEDKEAHEPVLLRVPNHGIQP